MAEVEVKRIVKMEAVYLPHLILLVEVALNIIVVGLAPDRNLIDCWLYDIIIVRQ